MGNDSADEADSGPHFQVEIAHPVVVGDALESFGVGHSGVVDHDVDAAEIVHGGLDHALRRSGVGDVTGNGQHHTLGGRTNFLRRLFQEIGPAGHDDYLCAFLGKALGGRLADAVAATRDYGHFVLEAQVHEPTPGGFD